MKESRKKYANFVIFWSQFLVGNPRRRGLMKVLWGLFIKQEELYFRLKSKSYLINNQELTPFSLDNLKMVFHTVWSVDFSSHISLHFLVVVCTVSLHEFESGKTVKTALLKKKTYHSFSSVWDFLRLQLRTRKATQNAEKYISDPGNFPCESTERRRWSWCCLFHWSIVPKIDFISLNLET